MSTNDQVWRCCLCSETYSSRWSLSAHMKAHPDRPWRGIRPPSQAPVLTYTYRFQCNFCSKSFETYKALRRHIDRHNKKKMGKSSPQASTSASASASQSEGRKALEFDLNKLPFDLNELPPECFDDDIMEIN